MRGSVLRLHSVPVLGEIWILPAGLSRAIVGEDRYNSLCTINNVKRWVAAGTTGLYMPSAAPRAC